MKLANPPTYHEVVISIAFLVALGIAGILLALGDVVPTELWGIVSTIGGVFVGGQMPSGGSTALRRELLEKIPDSAGPTRRPMPPDSVA